MANRKLETAVFGGGCFWCTEAIFLELKGVENVISGYAGGPSASSGQVPNYEQVSSGATGHAEVIKIEFDPSVISYRQLLKVFFATHDPTTPNRQGADIGTQYRSVIFFTSDSQKRQAEQYIEELQNSGDFSSRVVTELKPLEQFHAAEEYHQKYFQTNPNKPYCQLVINPKLTKLREQFAKIVK